MKLQRVLDSIPADYSRATWMDVIRPMVTQLDALSEGRASAYHGAMGTPPTVGTWVRGDWVKNNLPSGSGWFGWICIESGTPGTWKGFGIIEA